MIPGHEERNEGDDMTYRSEAIIIGAIVGALIGGVASVARKRNKVEWPGDLVFEHSDGASIEFGYRANGNVAWRKVVEGDQNAD